MDGGTVVLEAEDVRTVGLVAAGANVRAAFLIEGIVRAFARLDEPGARVWPVVGVELAPDADADAVMPEAAASFAAFPEQYVELRALRPEREPDEVERWLRAHGSRVPPSSA